MAIIRRTEETNNEQLALNITNGDLAALKAITEKFNFADEEAVLRYALAVLTKSTTDTLYVDDGGDTKVALKPSKSLKKDATHVDEEANQ